MGVDFITIDGPPGSNREEVFSLVKRFMFRKRGYAGLKLMSDFEESDPLIISHDSEINREDEQIRRIRACPNKNVVIMDYIAYVEARRINVARKVNYTSIREPRKKLEVILMPKEEVCRKALAEASSVGEKQLNPTSVGFIYNGYREYVSNNERRLLVVEGNNITPMGVMRSIWKIIMSEAKAPLSHCMGRK